MIGCLGVLGAGQMGAGIAQVAAQSGIEVCLADADLSRAQAGKGKILSSLAKLVEKGKIAADAVGQVDARIRAVDGIAGLAGCDLVVEAVTERESLKFELFRKLDEAVQKSAILASNTSSISITSIAACTKRPDRVVGMHFMNPVPVMKLVEGIRAIQTSDATARTTRALAERMGKTYVEVRDVPGFAVNRILMPMINEAVQALYEGIATRDDIDTAMKLGTNQPMGPLTLADFIGLDTCLAIMEVLHAGLGDSKYRPSPLLRQYAAAGWLGKKSGRGFYSYE